MTSSARSKTSGGIVTPRALAVLRLTTSLNLVGCSMGRAAGLAPFEDFVNESSRAPPQLLLLGPIAHHGASRLGVRPVKHARNSLLCREVHDLLPVLEGHAIADQEKRAGPLSGQLGQDALEIRRTAYFQGLELDAQRARGTLDFPPGACVRWVGRIPHHGHRGDVRDRVDEQLQPLSE